MGKPRMEARGKRAEAAGAEAGTRVGAEAAEGADAAEAAPAPAPPEAGAWPAWNRRRTSTLVP